MPEMTLVKEVDECGNGVGFHSDLLEARVAVHQTGQRINTELGAAFQRDACERARVNISHGAGDEG